MSTPADWLATLPQLPQNELATAETLPSGLAGGMGPSAVPPSLPPGVGGTSPAGYAGLLQPQQNGLLGLPLPDLPGMGLGNAGSDPSYLAGAQAADSQAVGHFTGSGVRNLRGAKGLINLARSQLGTPYVFGSENPDGSFDCSGLTKWVYEKYGIDLPHSAAQQMQATKPVDPSHLRPGMLLFFNYGRLAPGVADHVMIYAGGDRAIGAQPSTGGVGWESVDWNNVIGIGAVPGFNYKPHSSRRNGSSSSSSTSTRRNTSSTSKPQPSQKALEARRG